MDSSTKEAFLNKLIQNQRETIRNYVFFAFGLTLLGVIVFILSFFTSNLFPDDQTKATQIFQWLFSLSGTFVATLSAFPINQILSRVDTIHSLEASKLLENTKDKRLKELMWKIIEDATLK